MSDAAKAPERIWAWVYADPWGNELRWFEWENHEPESGEAEYIRADLVQANDAEIARCHARLEIDRIGRIVDGEIVMTPVPIDERAGVPDAVECRDATIELQQDEIDCLRAELDAAVAQERGRIAAILSSLPPAAFFPGCVSNILAALTPPDEPAAKIGGEA